MPWNVREHAGRHYAVALHYALHDDAWSVELRDAAPVPATGGTDATVTHLPGAAFLTTRVSDEDPAAEPTVRVHSPEEHVVPYEITRRCTEQTADQVERCRKARPVNRPTADQAGACPPVSPPTAAAACRSTNVVKSTAGGCPVSPYASSNVTDSFPSPRKLADLRAPVVRRCRSAWPEGGTWG